MREIGWDEFKKIALGILINFDEVCKKNNIKYSLAYGTLLGAVRHKGYIPWDDDIDVMMSREDYIKFLGVRNEMESKYKVLALETEEQYASPLAKIVDTNTVLYQKGYGAGNIDLGIYVDIFVLDYVSEVLEERRKVYKKCDFLQKIWRFCAGNPNPKHSKIINVLRKRINRTDFAKKIAQKMNIYAQKMSVKSTILSNLLFGETDREIDIVYKNEFEELCFYDFEGMQFLGFKNFDFHLTKWYGNYMELPPIEKRVSGHSYDVFWR